MQSQRSTSKFSKAPAQRGGYKNNSSSKPEKRSFKTDDAKSSHPREHSKFKASNQFDKNSSFSKNKKSESISSCHKNIKKTENKEAWESQPLYQKGDIKKIYHKGGLERVDKTGEFRTSSTKKPQRSYSDTKNTKYFHREEGAETLRRESKAFNNVKHFQSHKAATKFSNIASLSLGNVDNYSPKNKKFDKMAEYKTQKAILEQEKIKHSTEISKPLTPPVERFILFKKPSLVKKERHQDERYFSVLDIVSMLKKTRSPYDFLKKLRANNPNFKAEWGKITVSLTVKIDGKSQKMKCTNAKGVHCLIAYIPSSHAESLKKWIQSLSTKVIENKSEDNK